MFPGYITNGPQMFFSSRFILSISSFKLQEKNPFLCFDILKETKATVKCGFAKKNGNFGKFWCDRNFPEIPGNSRDHL